jgi:anti-sigma28 factor (negative regulator of flagellin synthesis)
MTVRPTQPGLTSRSDIARTGKSPAKSPSAEAQRHEAKSPAHGADQLDISSEARALQELDAADSVASGAVSNDRMREVARRIADGHYDRPEVAETVIQRLLSDL